MSLFTNRTTKNDLIIFKNEIEKKLDELGVSITMITHGGKIFDKNEKLDRLPKDSYIGSVIEVCFHSPTMNSFFLL